MNFSVLMSVYGKDNADYLNNAIASLFNQTLVPDEVLIVQDGPISIELKGVIDNWLQQRNEIRVLELSKNVGLAKALNAGLQECSNEYVARMDSDDVSHADRFKVQMDYLLSHPDISLLGAWYQQYDESLSKIVTERKVPEEHNAIEKYAQHRTPINHVTIIFKKADVLAVGGYPEKDGRFEDWWLSLKLIQNGFKLQNLPSYLVDVRGGEDFIQRRGGFAYLIQEIKTMRDLRRENLISIRALVFNVCIRTMVRLVPNFLRDYGYRLIRKT